MSITSQLIYNFLISYKMIAVIIPLYIYIYIYVYLSSSEINDKIEFRKSSSCYTRQTLRSGVDGTSKSIQQDNLEFAEAKFLTIYYFYLLRDSRPEQQVEEAPTPE